MVNGRDLRWAERVILAHRDRMWKRWMKRWFWDRT
jgi:hypothetical protein